MYKKFTEELPKPKQWIKCIINGRELDNTIYGVTEWIYCYDIKDSMALCSDNEKGEYVFPHGEEGYTHWLYKNPNL